MVLSEAEGLLRIASVREGTWRFWLQQSVEKALKVWLVHLGTIPPPTHDLNRLLRMLGRLTLYAVQFRYDADPSPQSRSCNFPGADFETEPNKPYLDSAFDRGSTNSFDHKVITVVFVPLGADHFRGVST
jgi:hypothetical protein